MPFSSYAAAVAAQQQSHWDDPLAQQLGAMQQNPQFNIFAAYQCQGLLNTEPSTIDEMQSDVSLWLKDWDK